MKKPFVISLVFHAALLLAALVVLPTPKAFEVKSPESIQVDISAVISDKSQKMATTKDPAPASEKPAPKETKVVKDVPPAPKVADEVKTAAREPVKPPPPPPPDTKSLDKMLKADEQQQNELQQKAEMDKAMADAQKIVEQQKQAEEKKKSDEKKKLAELKKAEDKKKSDEKKKLDQTLAEAQAQLNKIAGESTAPAKPSEKKGAPKQASKDASGADGANTATITAALVAKVKECFTIPPAAREVNVSVPIHFILNRDGSVQGQPEVAQGGGDPIFDATARAAISAIVQCQSYELPADQYDQWKDNILDFNPKLISG